MSLLLSSLSRARQTAKSAALVLFGISAIARRQLAGQGAVLTITQINQPSSTSSVQFQDPRANRSPSRLTLSRGSTMQFSFAYSDVTTGNTACDNATTMNVRFTRNDTSIVVTPQYPLQPCNNGTMWVSPFYG